MYCKREISSGLNNITLGRSGTNYIKSGKSGMEYESDWTRHYKSSALTANVIRSATSFIPWSLKVPIGDGFHEFL